MTETVKLRLERSPSENLVSGIAAIVSTAMLYYSLHPDVAERHTDKLRSIVDRIVHRISVGQTFAAIRNLPETRNHD